MDSTRRFASGQIAYRGPQGETGREWFELVAHPGGRTVRAFCEMDEIGLSRDVSLSLDPLHRPLDAFVRIIQNGAVIGSTWFLVQPDAIVCEGFTAELGRFSQRRPLQAPLTYLGLHPLACDALITLNRGHDRIGEFVPIDGLTNSRAPAGEVGLHAMPATIDVAYLGPEVVTVGAGTFAAHRFALRWSPDWSPADIWVTRADALFLRLDWPQIAASYELMSLRNGA